MCQFLEAELLRKPLIQTVWPYLFVSLPEQNNFNKGAEQQETNEQRSLTHYDNEALLAPRATFGFSSSALFSMTSYLIFLIFHFVLIFLICF